MKTISKALNLKNNFPPYLNIYLELLSKSNNLSLLKKMIKKYWSLNPNFIFRSMLIKIILDNKLDSLNFINQIIKNNKENNESKKLLIFLQLK